MYIEFGPYGLDDEEYDLDSIALFHETVNHIIRLLDTTPGMVTIPLRKGFCDGTGLSPRSSFVHYTDYTEQELRKVLAKYEEKISSIRPAMVCAESVLQDGLRIDLKLRRR